MRETSIPCALSDRWCPDSQEVQEGLQSALGVPVLEHYGSSETAQISATTPPGPCKPGTCGIPWPDSIKIVGHDGQQVPAGEQGEIL